MRTWLPQLRPTGRGITENVIANIIVGVAGAAATVIGATILAWIAEPRTGLGFVILFLCSLAVLSIAWMVFAIGWRRLYPLAPPQDVLASCDVVAPSYSQAPVGIAVAPAGKLISAPRIELDNGRVVFKGVYSRSGRDLIVYTTYAQAGGPGMDETPISILESNLKLREPHIKLTAIGRFDRNETADVTVGHLISVEGSQQMQIQWGDKHLNNKKVGITGGSYFGYIIFVESGGAAHAYPFAVINRSVGQNAAPAMILSADLLSAHMQMGREVEQQKQ